MKAREIQIQNHMIKKKPYYLPVGDEVELFTAAYEAKIPVLLKGPTGTGKTRFVEYMAYMLGKQLKRKKGLPVITVACHEDLTTTDLVGKFLLKGEETVWMDGPLSTAVKKGGICYLDEIVEARKDTTVIIHPLADHRRILPVDKKGTVIEAHESFFLVISYNPGYQSIIKELKQSTKQRFIAINFDYPDKEKEAEIIAHESGVDKKTAADLARIGEKIRHIEGHALTEGASTRVLVYAGSLIKKGISARRACDVSITSLLTEEKEVRRAINEVISAVFPG
ncbi:CbbQ/NirQ/NorQ/GpvN family protein [Desulfosudis oleivorans]|uniref:ATPase associated with various cellular activities AAA_5 n=1 Tax=Desulfosudis oleivorans (strain DSM 6200 / JCM 39069 / Hxd3) TaxID=96561 RepID=A8ZZR5_DESOH|nr:CbbQ/NirQ/NorQ/GpvN family protein [Desulfosudis oleivorans]ABW68937.1 ATPase associated with various cellular activities AAA_5 [Desulfosudis oleivorans Hxd3]